MQSDGPERPKGARGAAFVCLFRAAYPRMISRLRRCGVEGPDAEDIAQRAFEIYVERRIEHPKPRAWLVETARRLAANWRDLSRHRFEELTRPSDLEPLVFDPAPTVDLIAELSKWCDYAERLSAQDRQTLRYYLLGYTFTEAGDEHDITRSAAWSRLQNVLAKVCPDEDDEKTGVHECSRKPRRPRRGVNGSRSSKGRHSRRRLSP